MKNLTLFASAVLFTACGYSEDKFAEDFADKLCETCSDYCATATTTGTTTGGTDDACDFDSKAAKDCIDGAWTCEDLYGFQIPSLPDACADVCGSATGTTGTTTTTTSGT